MFSQKLPDRERLIGPPFATLNFRMYIVEMNLRQLLRRESALTPLLSLPISVERPPVRRERSSSLTN
jgi:hypothetical protein